MSIVDKGNFENYLFGQLWQHLDNCIWWNADVFLFLSPTITRGFLWAKLNQNDDDLSSTKISSQVTEKTSVF